ncbi:MAG TPA: hypothetical protein VFI26_00565 [Lysobacter sp.]|nr:hypothetical protein [Lysobacter sp.]
MAANMGLKFRKAAVICLIAAAALILAGCQFRPDVVSARSHSEGQQEVVQVTLRSADAKAIKNRQQYFSLVIINCTGKLERYPAEPTIGGQRASDFHFPTDGETVQIIGKVPAKIFEQYVQPCAFLEGGGYLTGTIKSSVAPIVRDSKV